METLDEFHRTLDDFDEDDVSPYRFAHKPADTDDSLAGLEQRLGFSVPADLKALLREEGAIHHPSFGDAWQTLELYAAAELLERPLGLIDVIEHEWGGRPELRRGLAKASIDALNAGYVVFGYRYVDDNVHDYLFFNRAGDFDHLEVDQDQMDDAIEALEDLLPDDDGVAPELGYALEVLLEEQFDEIVDSLE